MSPGDIVSTAFALGCLALFVWMLKTRSSPDEVIYPSDSRQIGLTMGKSGGLIGDATVAQFAVKRFEETYRRRPSIRELATLVAMVRNC